MKCLNELNPGDSGTVVKIVSKGNLFKRITEMGITAGVDVAVERIAPLGDPIEIKVKGYHLSLRKEEAAKIQVQMA